MKQYRIGDFARALGVTTDFLKHYESAGLISACQHENGYRWYPFDQSARVIEYLRLRNYGVQIKEMADLLKKGPEEVFAQLDERACAMAAEARRLTALAEEHRRIRRWHRALASRAVDWEIRRMGALLFLPHSENQDFRKDASIPELLAAWCSMFPVTKSALAVDLTADGGAGGASPIRGERLRWGLAVEEALLERAELPREPPVERFAFTKAFVLHFSALPEAFLMQSVADGSHPALRKMASLGLRPAGTGFLVSEMRGGNDTGATSVGMGRFIIPIAD